MARIFGIIIIGLIALNIGLGAALWKTRTHAESNISKLRDEIQSRTAFGGERGGGGKGDGRKGDRGQLQFKQVQDRLNLTPAQVRSFREFMRARRDIRRSVMEDLAQREAAITEALSKQPADLEALSAVRQTILENQAAANQEAFLRFTQLIESLTQEQREAMLELTQGRPNSLLFL